MKAMTVVLLAGGLLVGSGTALAFDHGPFDRLLKTYVKGGLVDYAGIRAKDREALAAYLRVVATTKVDGWKRQDQLAFYLNAYNALVIRAVVERLPKINSVQAISGFFDKLKYRVAGRRLTLNALESKIIRPRFKDPRIHFALVCAARSCPPLHARAFKGSSLDRSLDRLARRFINSKRGVRIEGDKVRVSKLFQWYAVDFRRAAGSVGAYLARYHDGHADTLSAARQVKYLPYSWALNAATR